LNSPKGVAFDSNGDLYVADTVNHRIRRIERATGLIDTVAGNGRTGGVVGDGMPATEVPVAHPASVVVRDGYVYFSTSMRVRRVSVSTGIIETVAGGGNPSGNGDGGPAIEARVQPGGIAFDSEGNLYITEWLARRIRRVDARTKVITTIAGGGSDDGEDVPATSSSLLGPRDVSVDRDGNVFIADWADRECGACPDPGRRVAAHGYRIRRIHGMAGTIETVVGTGEGGYGLDGVDARAATLTAPRGLTVAPDGSLYVADTESGRVRNAVLCKLLEAPVLVSPEDGERRLPIPARQYGRGRLCRHVTTSWEPVEGASHYHVVFVNVTPVVDHFPVGMPGFDTDRTTLTVGCVQPMTRYDWKVVAHGDPYCPGLQASESPVWTFVTGDGRSDLPGDDDPGGSSRP
jgi:sugar lactone lactonase YvrE